MIVKNSKATIVKAYPQDSLKKTASLEAVFDKAKLSDILQEVHEVYKISKRPEDYIFVVARALTANVPNENLDCFGEKELLSIKKDGRFTYETFQSCPLLEEHRDEDLSISGGVIIDAFYDDTNADDKKVITLIAVDRFKKPAFANNVLNGRIESFSMGCVCESTTCSLCGNEAATPDKFCAHIKNKHAMRDMGVFEWCNGVTYRELSDVATPADPMALSHACCYYESDKIVCKNTNV